MSLRAILIPAEPTTLPTEDGEDPLYAVASDMVPAGDVEGSS